MRTCRPAHEELVISHSEIVPAVYQLDSQHARHHIAIRQAAIQPSYTKNGPQLVAAMQSSTLYLLVSRLTLKAPLPAKTSSQASLIELSLIQLLDDSMLHG